MKLSKSLELVHLFSTYFSDSDPDKDSETAVNFVKKSSPMTQSQVLVQLQSLLNQSEIPLEELGNHANRWFSNSNDAKQWVTIILEAFQGKSITTSALTKDSNGSPLTEGDSVQIIKDLKVKGSATDLKRGTWIKKIHLVDDPEVIECRVGGSTLVLTSSPA